MTVPNNKILILAAVCLSVVACVGAYKIGEARKASLAALNSQGAVYLDIQATNDSNAILQEALKKISQDTTLGTSSEENPFAPKEGDTLTDSFAKNIFLSYAEKENGVSNLDNVTISNKIISAIDTSSTPQAEYGFSRVKISNDATQAGVRAYGNKVGAILKDNYTAISNGKADMSLAEMAAIHSKIGREIIEVPVPGGIAQSHLALANGYSILGSSFTTIASEEKKDPLKAVLAIRAAKDAADNLTSTYTTINSYFANNGILFSNEEAGIIWSRIDLK